MTDTPATPPATAPPSDDPRASIRRVYDAMAADIEQQLRAAPANQRASLIVKYMPMLAKQLDEAETDDGLDDLKTEMQAMREEMRAALLTRAPVDLPPTALPPRDE